MQKHRATRLHYDFRLEAGGVLASWAIPKGPSFNTTDRRLAMHVEDHPYDYRDFEGIIPEGNYGAGEVIVWDRGSYELVEGTDPVAEIAAGKIKFIMHGKKLRGMFTLVHIKGRGGEENAWLLIKDHDEFVDPDYDVNDHAESVKSGKTLEDIAKSKHPATWQSDRPATTMKPRRSGAAAEPSPKASSTKTSTTKTTQAATMPKTKTRTKTTPATKATPAPKTTASRRAASKRAPALALPVIESPMLATVVDAPFDDPQWIFEIKWDGYRALAVVAADRTVTLTSRRGNDLLGAFGELARIGDALTSVPAILDGEIVALDADGRSSFQALQSRDVRLGGKKTAPAPVTFVAFDVLFADGHDLRDLPLEERKRKLEALVIPDRGVLYSKHIDTEGKRFFELAERQGLEGIIGKRRDSPYRSRRTREWVKIKAGRRQEFVIGGWTEPRGSRTGFGALLVGVYDDGAFRYAGHVGTGFDGTKLTAIKRALEKLERPSSPFSTKPKTNTKAHFTEPKLVAEVKFAEWTRDDLLRQPVFLGLREDKPPERASARNITTAKKTTVEIGGRTLSLTNLDKPLFPDGITKGDLIAYYRAVAPFIIPHLRDRPLTLERYPNGVGETSFFEKEAPRGTPDWVPRVEVPSTFGKRSKIAFVLCNDEPTLVFLANLASIVLHVWTSRTPTLDRPDFVLFDLDPWEGCSIATLARVALRFCDELEAIGLDPLVKTTGGSGLHVVIPLETRYGYDVAKTFAELVARRIHGLEPEHTTLLRATAKRPHGTVYLDYVQVGEGKTLVSPFSVRPRAKAPVSMPLAWSEVEKMRRKRAAETEGEMARWTIRNVPRLLADAGDPWAGAGWKPQRLEGALEKARSLWE